MHWEAVKWILRYIKGRANTRLHIRKSNSKFLSMFIDVDQAGCLDYHRSTGGFTVSLRPNLIPWSSLKQPQCCSEVQKMNTKL